MFSGSPLNHSTLLLKIQIPPISILCPPQFGHFHSSFNSQEDHPAPPAHTHRHLRTHYAATPITLQDELTTHLLSLCSSAPLARNTLSCVPTCYSSAWPKSKSTFWDLQAAFPTCPTAIEQCLLCASTVLFPTLRIESSAPQGAACCQGAVCSPREPAWTFKLGSLKLLLLYHQTSPTERLELTL